MADGVTEPMDRVVIGLMDGATLEGRLRRFVPFLPFLQFAPLDDNAPGQRLPRSQVAWVGFQLETGAAPPQPAPDSQGVEVEVAGGRSFSVATVPGAKENALGFSGIPVATDLPCRALFFYREAIVRVAETELPQTAPAPAPVVEVPAAESAVLVEQPQQKARPRGRIHLSELLLERKLITEEQLAAARKLQAERPGSVLGQTLLEMGVVGEADIYRAIARRYGLAFVDLDDIPVSAKAVEAVDRKLLRQYGALPLDIDESTCLVAVSDPRLGTGAAFRFVLNREVKEVIATPGQIKGHLLAHLTGVAAAKERKRPEFVVNDDKAVVKMVDQIIRDAYTARVSDIHIEPNGMDRNTLIRFRVDGECYVYQELPPQFWKAVVSRLKIMASLDIGERRLPQDGKIKFTLDEATSIELRVATVPTQAGNEDVVMRLLARSEPLPIDRMGLTPANLARLKSAIARPYGLILCVGPTGSGKTTTLHSALGAINDTTRKIWTAEDPVEITQKGIRQVQVDTKVGMTFARAMRAFLRADPDVVMIGEMRDQETAQIAVEASLTGHLVFSTLHTNTAPETITRLLDMGLDPFTFADSLVLIVAQRLARRLCPACREARPATRAEYEQIRGLYGPEFEADFDIGDPSGLLLATPNGCRECNHSGFRGRVALHEVLLSDDHLAKAIQERALVSAIRHKAIIGGMKTLLQDGIGKVIAGDTGLKQVLAQCSR